MMGTPPHDPGLVAGLVDVHRAANGRRAFGLELHLVGVGAFSKAIRIFTGFGTTRCLEQGLDARDLKLREALLRASATAKTAAFRAGMLALHFKLSDALRPVQGGHRAQGAEAFFGRQHELVVDAEGRPVLHTSGKQAGKQVRRYLPAPLQGGFAAELGKSYRQLCRYWRHLVRHGVWKAWRPRRDAPGARLTKAGTQVYAQRTLALGVPRVVSDRLPAQRRGRRPRAVVDDGFVHTEWSLAPRVDDLRELEALLDDRDIPF